MIKCHNSFEFHEVFWKVVRYSTVNSQVNKTFNFMFLIILHFPELVDTTLLIQKEAWTLNNIETLVPFRR